MQVAVDPLREDLLPVEVVELLRIDSCAHWQLEVDGGVGQLDEGGEEEEAADVEGAGKVGLDVEMVVHFYYFGGHWLKSTVAHSRLIDYSYRRIWTPWKVYEDQWKVFNLNF